MFWQAGLLKNRLWGCFDLVAGPQAFLDVYFEDPNLICS